MTQAIGDPATEGRQALGQRRWTDARVAFERALADGAGPDALEGLTPRRAPDRRAVRGRSLFAH